MRKLIKNDIRHYDNRYWFLKHGASTTKGRSIYLYMRNIRSEAETMLKNIKKSVADEERQEQNRITENRLKREEREQAEADRLEQSNELLNKYIGKAMSRQKANEDSWNQSIKNIHDSAESRRKAEEEAHRKRDIDKMLKRGKELIAQGSKYN